MSWVSAGITPSFFWLAKIVSRNFSQPLSNLHRVDLVNPLLGRLVRRMRAAGHIIKEERFVGGDRVHAVQIFDGLIRHVGGEVVTGMPIHGKIWV